MSDSSSISASRVWVVLARAYGSMASFVEERIAAEGIGLSDFMVLEVLLHKGSLTMSAIGEKVLLANASMTSAIDRLEEKAFVIRKYSDEDRRIRLVELTARGRKLIVEVYRRHEQELESLMSGLSAEERAGLHRGLKKIGFAAQNALAHGLQDGTLSSNKSQKKGARR
jgi:MarR family transcriptional regulator, 2-MHQ and catechol-resistance regulon repressor